MFTHVKLAWGLVTATSLTAAALAMAGCGGSDNSTNNSSGLPGSRATMDQVQRGRLLVLSSGCGDCHSQGKVDPADAAWMAGSVGTNVAPGDTNLGPFGQSHAPNLTPDPTQGALIHSTERQVFNVLRWGLDPGDARTDKVILSKADLPPTPKYVAPPMPWPAFRHKSDDELWAIVAYVKHGLKPNPHAVTPTTQSPDGWAALYANVGPYPAPAFPTSVEQFTP